MGFCLFNNIAVAAAHACDKHGLSRVAVVDFDVHHGNGTQAIFDTDPRVMYLSSHQMPLYPDTGYANERGIGNVLNAPLPPGCGSSEFRRTWRERLLPTLESFRPQLLFISAGFDAHRNDPLAQLELDADDFRWLTTELVAIAARHAHGRIVSMLEGGYDLAGAARVQRGARRRPARRRRLAGRLPCSEVRRRNRCVRPRVSGKSDPMRRRPPANATRNLNCPSVLSLPACKGYGNLAARC